MLEFLTTIKPLAKQQGTLNLPLQAFQGEVDRGRGNPRKNSRYFEPDQKLLHAPPNFEESIALAFLKATCSQIPYWVHFTFKIQNPIYMCTST